MSGYEVVRYNPSFQDQVLLLQRHLLGDDPERNRKYFEWKYEHNPFTEDPLVYLAVHRDRVVAMLRCTGIPVQEQRQADDACYGIH